MSYPAGERIRLEILTSNATRAVLDSLVAAFERESMYRISIEADSASVMLQRIKDGQIADAALLNAPELDELVRLNIIDPSSRRLFARSRIGVAVRAGASHPDISTVEALRHAMLESHAIAHTVHGASGKYVPHLLQRLGIADEVKTVTRPGGLIGKVVAAGEAEMAVQQISELLVVPGIELIGPLPDELQRTYESAVGIFTRATQPQAAEALLRFMTAPSAAATLREKGLEPAA